MTRSLMQISPFFSRWPSFWEDDDFSSLTKASNNLDVYATQNEVVVRANVAGVDADDIDLTFEKGVLYIQAERREEEGNEDAQHYSRSSWNYSYRVALPEMIDSNKDPEVTMKDGMLTVKFQKSEASKPKKLKVVAG